MHKFRVWWNSFKTVALLISFIVNMVLLVVLLIVMMQIFQIKNGILEPLIDGLHRNFVGLDQAVIERTIEVEDEIPVQFDLALNQNTNVVLTSDVPIAASASFTLPGGGGVINGRVDIVLPRGLILPVELNMTVPVDTTIPINLPVAVSIPLKETQLHTPFDNLRSLLEPYVRVLDNLPSDWGDVPDFTVDAIQGEGVNLVSPTEGSENPWPGPDAGTVDTESGVEPGTESGTEPGTDAVATPTEGETAGPEVTPTPIQDMGIIAPPPQ
ncbi:MAG: hypothetical protein HY866_09155 [Chloroflexi bacterium]|nr:hypothetical protein [Chloroflexota bacterium]